MKVEDFEEKVEREKEDGESWKQELQEITGTVTATCSY